MASFAELAGDQYDHDNKQDNDDTLGNVKHMICTDEKGYKISLFVNTSKSIRYQCGLCSNICYNAVELRCSSPP